MIFILSISGGGGGGGPFGDVVNDSSSIGVGFSDAALLVVSVIGFVFLAVTVYSIVILRLQTHADFQKHEEAEMLNYEERLARADVATLTRAQRRARARTIMKQKRRVTPAAQAPAAAAVAHEEDDEGQEGQVLLLQDAPQNEEQEDHHHHHHQGDVDDDDNNDDHLHNHQHASRKERQKMAKAAEKEERRVYDQERRKQQEQAQQMAQREKRERERQQSMRLEEERRLRKDQQVAEERQRREAWNTFLSGPDKTKTLSVDEWIHELKKGKQQRRYVNIDKLAASFAVSTDLVTNRIHELIQQRRVAGVIITNTTGSTATTTSSSLEFVYFSNQELHDLAIEIEKRGSISPAEMADLCNTICAAEDSSRKDDY